MIYEFIDESKHLSLTSRPAEAMMYNGQYLEDLVTGYKTVNVRGRETLALSIVTSGILPARDGEIIEQINGASRVITVTYALTASDNAAFRTAYDALKHHLTQSREVVPIKFLDDPSFTYYGLASEMPEVEPGVNTVVGEIMIFCSDPYKYADALSVSGVGSLTYIPEGITKTLRPILQVTLADAATKITIHNITTGNKIILNGDYAAGNVIVVDATNDIVTRNGGSIKAHLDPMTSDFFHFLVSPGDQLSVSPATATLQLTYRRKLT